MPTIIFINEDDIMAGSVNKVILLGNVGNEPDIRTTQNGKEIANISLATTESWRDKATGERKDKTEWHRIVIFNEGLVNVVRNYVKKGSKLYIEGALQTRKWVDNSGVERYSTEIVLQGFNSSLTMLDSKGSSSGSYDNSNASNFQNQNNAAPSSQKNNAPAQDFAADELEDEIPF